MHMKKVISLRDVWIFHQNFAQRKVGWDGDIFMPDNSLKYTRARKLKFAKEHVDDGLSYEGYD